LTPRFESELGPGGTPLESLIACCDGLTGFEDAICSAFPGTVVQRCVVHYADVRIMPTSVKGSLAPAREVALRSA